MMNTRRPLAAVVFALALGGCATELDTSESEFVLDAAAVLDEGVIVGALDWVASTSLTGTPKTAAKATGYVSIPQANARCSGFLIGRDLFMTNHHCIPDAAAAFGVTVNFKYESVWDESGVVACDEFIGANQTLDYSIVRCKGAPGDTYGYLTLDARTLTTTSTLQLFHQQCDYFTDESCAPTKKMSPGRVTSTTAMNNRITHNADMLGGSSGGALVAANTTNVVAINNAHVTNGTTAGRGTTNIGVPMSLIVPDMRARLPQLFSTCAAIPAAGRVIDEDDGCVTLGGEARYWRSVSGAGNDGDLVWTGTTNNSTAGNSAIYALNVASSGRYDVKVWIDGTYGTATRARYTVTHAAGTTDVVIDQNAVTTSGYVSLGAFTFNAGVAGSVRVNDNTGDRSQQLVVDALSITPVGNAPAPPPPTASCTQVRIDGATSLNVRPDPNTSRAPVAVVAGGDVLTRTGSVNGQTVRGTAVWYAITTPAGVSGYISSSYAVCVN
jgi:hypothetical protein